jgi:hypothetical protein
MFDTKHFVTDSKQTINCCFIPEASDSVVKSVSRARRRRCVRQNYQFEVSRLFTFNAHKNKQMLVFNFIFDLLSSGRGSTVSYVAFLGLHELK